MVMDLKDFLDNADRWLYLEAARKILNEFESRGFTTYDTSKAKNLDGVIADIIKDTIRENFNQTTLDDEVRIGLGEDGMENNLQNQIT